MLRTGLLEMVLEIDIMTKGNTIKFRVCTSVFFFVLHIACILNYFFFFPNLLSHFIVSVFFSCMYRTDLFPKQC